MVSIKNKIVSTSSTLFLILSAIKPAGMLLMAFNYVYLIVESDGNVLSIIVSAGPVLTLSCFNHMWS
jgi:hypothetical protein